MAEGLVHCVEKREGYLTKTNAEQSLELLIFDGTNRYHLTLYKKIKCLDSLKDFINKMCLKIIYN